MTEHLVCLSEVEARAAKDGRLRLIVRPAVPPSPFDVGDDITVEWATDSIKSPLGVPGDVLLGKEAVWTPTCLNCGTLKYVADHPQKPGYMYERIPALRVPRDLIRHRLPVVEAGVMRADDMGVAEIEAAGFQITSRPPAFPPPDADLDGPIKGVAAWDMFVVAWKMYATEFNRRWGRKVRFGDGVWLWYARVGGE